MSNEYKSDDDILESFYENESVRICCEQLEIEWDGDGVEGFEADHEYDSESECDSETFSEWISRREERIY